MKFEFDNRTGTMQPKKNEEIYFAKSQGGGLIVDDKKHNIKFIIERDGRITKLFGSFDKDRLNLYDMRDARMISERVLRLLGPDHKYSDFHYFLKGYVMGENFVKSCTDFINESIFGNMSDKGRGEVVKKEDEIFSNIKELKPVDMGVSVLWADRDIESDENTCFSFSDANKIIKNSGWRLPTALEYEELLNCAITIDEDITIRYNGRKLFFSHEFNTDYYGAWVVPEEGDECSVFTFPNGPDELDDAGGVSSGDTSWKCKVRLVKDKDNPIKESLFGNMADTGRGEAVKKEKGRIIGTLEDGTKLIISNDAFSDGELVDFDGSNIYTFNESGYEPTYVAVITDENTDVYYKYDEDSEDIVNMVRCFDADESLRTNNDFGMLRALMNQDEWDNSCIDDLEVSNEGNYVKFEFSGFEFVIYDDIDKAKDDAVEDAIEIEKESLERLKNSLSQKYLSSSESEKIRKQFHDFIDNIRNNCGNDGFDEDELKDVFEESFEFDYDEFDEDDAIEALLSKEIIEDTEEYFDLDEDGEIDHSLPKFDYQDYKDKYVEKSLEDLDDFVDEYIFRFGYDGIEDYIDFDKVGERYVDIDGPGHWLASYDGEDREQRIDDVKYYIYRME